LRLLLLAGAFVIAWGLSLHGPFHFDDHSLLRDPRIVSPDGWLEVWRPLQTRPLTQFSFWLSYQVGGNSPVGFHVWNLALHALNCGLVWLILSRLAPAAALLATLLFAVHPVQAEPVNYIFARSTLLMSSFCLMALWDWIREHRWRAVLWFGLAVLAKEECVTFPLFLLLLDRQKIAQAIRPAGVMLGLALAAGLRAIAATAATPGSGAGAEAGITPIAYALVQGPVVLLRYMRFLLVPYSFTVDPQIDRDPAVLFAFGCWALIGVLCVWSWRKGNIWFLAGVLLLMPSSSIFPAEDLAADRRLYLPMLAFGTLLAGWLILLPKQVWVALAAMLVVVSFSRTQVWNSEASLWREAVERSPGKVRPRIQLARVSGSEDAKRLLAEAAKLEPDNPDIPNELGLHWMRAGNPAEALGAFGRALALAPSDAKTINNRGAALFQLAQADAARQDFRRALQIDPCLEDARRNLRLAGGTSEGLPACR
jgi:hypothetical protein